MKLKLKMLILGLGLVIGMTAGAVPYNISIDGQPINGSDITAINVNPTTGDISIAAGGKYTVTNNGGGGGGPQVVINSLTSDKTSITEGGSVVISWSTTDAGSCTPSGGVAAWTQTVISPLASGSSAPIVLNTQGTYTFTLQCSNATPSSTSRSVSVTVNPVVANSACPADFVAPLSGQKVTFDALTGYAWPGPSTFARDVDIPKLGYLAIEFNTGSSSIDGIYKTVTYYATQGVRFGAISKCAGDFTNHLPDLAYRCTKQWYTGGSLYWTTEPNPTSLQCVLAPNTTYYMNLTFTDGKSSSTNTCTSALCRTEFNSGWY